MSHVAIHGVDPSKRGAHIGFDPDADVIPGKPTAIWHRTAALAQQQAALAEIGIRPVKAALPNDACC
jgi:hypothetical protein